MSKIAVIDIGSNSVRMVVFDALARAPHYFFNEKSMCRLGEGLGETGYLSASGVQAAKSELDRFVFLARAMQVSRLDIVATAAVREAKDGAEFCEWIANNLDETVRVLSGEEEARLSAQGVLVGWPDADGVICDIGGSSMELIEVHGGVPKSGITTKLGPLSIAGLDKQARRARFESELAKIDGHIPSKPKQLYLVGGSWRAFAKVDMLRKSYPFPILHEYALSQKDIAKTIAYIKERGIEALEKDTDVSASRLELLPLASKVLGKLLEKLEPENIAISAYGLREGVLFEAMPNWMRESDPLISATERLEAENARFPGYGRRLFDWLAPLREEGSFCSDRLTLAACLLHDTNWRYHPDYRAKLSFETVAQANISGVTHEERIFLACALASRYENKPDHAFNHPALVLLDDDMRESAIALGRAMRLGAMISGAVGSLLDHTALEVTRDKLILRITESRKALYGESVEKRLLALGRISKREVEVIFI